MFGDDKEEVIARNVLQIIGSMLLFLGRHGTIIVLFLNSLIIVSVINRLSKFRLRRWIEWISF